MASLFERRVDFFCPTPLFPGEVTIAELLLQQHNAVVFGGATGRFEFELLEVWDVVQAIPAIFRKPASSFRSRCALQSAFAAFKQSPVREFFNGKPLLSLRGKELLVHEAIHHILIRNRMRLLVDDGREMLTPEALLEQLLPFFRESNDDSKLTALLKTRLWDLKGLSSPLIFEKTVLLRPALDAIEQGKRRACVLSNSAGSIVCAFHKNSLHFRHLPTLFAANSLMEFTTKVAQEKLKAERPLVAIHHSKSFREAVEKLIRSRSHTLIVVDDKNTPVTEIDSFTIMERLSASCGQFLSLSGLLLTRDNAF